MTDEREIILITEKIKGLEKNQVKISEVIANLTNAINSLNNAVENLDKALLTALNTQSKILKILADLKLRVLKLEQHKPNPEIPLGIKMAGKKEYIS